jgi:hypothetical protein
MPVQVQGPDGKTYQFPDGTDKAAAIGYFKKKGIGVKQDNIPSMSSATPAAPSFRERVGAFVDAATQPIANPPRPTTVGAALRWPLEQLGADAINVTNSAARTLIGLPSSVVDTFNAIRRGDPEGINSIDPGEQSTQIYDQYQETAKTDPNLAAQNLLGQLIALRAAGKLTEAGGRFVGPMTQNLKDTLSNAKEGIHATAQRLTGVGGRAVQADVAAAAKSAGLAAKATEESNRAALSKFDADLRIADQNNVNAHVKWKAAVAEVDKANALAEKATEEYNSAQQSQYQANLDEAAKANLKAHIKYLQDTADVARENALKAKRVEESNRAEMSRYEKELAEAQRKNTAAHVKHQAAKAEADLTNQGTRAAVNARADLDTKIQDTTQQFDVALEKQRHEALDEGNRRYNAVNEVLNPKPADNSKLQIAWNKAKGSGGVTDDQLGIDLDSEEGVREKLPGTAPTPGFLNSFGKALRNDNPATYQDMQADYSWLGNQLSSGRLSGVVYHAYDVLHDALGEQMQAIADKYGKGQELKSAREYWKRMKQTFGDPFSFGDEANRQLGQMNPEYTKGQLRERWNRLAESFNPELTRLRSEIEGMTTRRDALPKESARPSGKIPRIPDEKTVEPPQLQKAPTPKESPAYPEEKTVEPPKLKPPAEAKEYPLYPEEQTVTPPKVNPVERPEVSTQAVRDRLLEKWARGEEGLNKWQVRSLLTGPIGALAGLLFDHGVGAGVGYGLGVAFGPEIAARLVEIPKMRAWLMRPPAGELETLQKLPYADRIQLTDGLKKVAQKAQSQGVIIAPELVQYLGMGAILPKSRQLQETRDRQRQSSQ